MLHTCSEKGIEKGIEKGKCRNTKMQKSNFVLSIFSLSTEFKARHLRNQKVISHYSNYVCTLFILYFFIVIQYARIYLCIE